MSAIGAISPVALGAVNPVWPRRSAGAAPSTPGEGGVNDVARGPAVVLGGRLASVSPVSGPDAIGQTAGVAPVPPVKPVVYRPGAAVNLSI